jgi:hypothetical protein
MAAEVITQFFAVLGGKRTYLKAIDYSKEWAQTTSAGAKAAKEWRNQLMGFDEINKLEEPSSSIGGGGSGIPGYEQMFEELPINSKLTDLIDMIKNHIADLELFASGALLAIGLLLTLTGSNVPLGLGLIAAGAFGLSHTLRENWDYLTGNITRTLSSIMIVAAGGMFGIGAVLALSGANVPLGLALMVAGALTFANAAALNWEEMPRRIKLAIRNIDAILGVSLLGIGAILTFTGANIPLGIGLMVAGAVSLAAAAALSEGKIVEQIKLTIAMIMQILGTALLAIGVILAFSGANLPLGIGLMAIGAASLGAAAALNGGTLIEEISRVLGTIMRIIATSLMAIGLILAITGNLPLGIALIAAGVGTMAAGNAISPDPFMSYVNAALEALDWLIGKIKDAFGWAKSATQQLNEMAKAGSYAKDIGNGRSVSYSPMKGGVYASGGFPSGGELFVAREAGPELVGQIGNKTAVANNDQIVQGISMGVYNAVLNAMSISGGNNSTPVRIYLDGREIASTTTKYQQQYARAGTM